VTGTPGTGKTTAVDRLETDLEVVTLTDVIKDRDFVTERDEGRDTLIADLDAVREWLDDREDVILESHLAHHLPVDRVIVLRCHPAEIEQRLADRGESSETVAENGESEALDVILAEAVRTHGEDAVYEIETTDRSPGAVAREIEAVLRGDREPSAGTVSYVDYL
jgi:adenylate kinase